MVKPCMVLVTGSKMLSGAMVYALSTLKKVTTSTRLYRLPESGTLLIKDNQLSNKSKVTMLGVEVTMPNLRPPEIPSLYSQTLTFSAAK